MVLKSLRLMIIALLLAYSLVINAFLVAYFAQVDTSSIVAQMTHVAHWLTLAALAALLITVLLRSNIWVILLLVPGAVAFFLWYGTSFLPKTTPNVGGIEVIAMSYNVWDRHSDPDAVAAVIRDVNADVVALQEVNPLLGDMLSTELANQYPSQVYQNPNRRSGLALLSRYPVSSYWEDQFSLRAALDFGGTEIIAYSFHASNRDYDLGQSYNDSRNRNYIQIIRGQLEQEEAPVLMMCDCNTTPLTQQHRWLDEIMDDAFQRAGWGFGLTHPGYLEMPFPTIRIDYIWYSDHFTPVTTEVWDSNGTSDHYPVISTMILREQ